MSKVKVHQATDANGSFGNPAFGKVEEALDAIRRRAYELFEKRGGAPGGHLDDWLQAEKDLFVVPHVHVNESEKSFRMTISAAGFDAGDIDVIALPNELLVEAKTERRLEPRRDLMRAGALESKILYRRFDLTTPIETDQVTARMDEGSLTIDAPKKIDRRVAVRAAAA
jgi:HSP20 family molecular chaperone IbpA